MSPYGTRRTENDVRLLTDVGALANIFRLYRLERILHRRDHLFYLPLLRLVGVFINHWS
jgi:hypothetical protein